MIDAGGSKECPCFRVFGSVREGVLGRGDIMSPHLHHEASQR